MLGKRLLWALMICILVPGILAVYAFGVDRSLTEYDLHMELVGERVITLECGDSFTDPGATVILKDLQTGEASTEEAEVTGTVDTQKVGVYTLRYQATANRKKCTLYRQVRVVDTQMPVITLTTDPAYFTLPDTTYTEEGFQAQDNYDGDLTDRVIRYTTEDSVVYTVTDSSGNRSQTTRKIVYNDPVPPVLTLLGEEMVIVDQGIEYTDKGCTAADNCDGDITDKIKVSGSVNTKMPGKYIITYSVSDSYQNEATLSRMVFVKEKTVEQVNNPVKGDKFIYLTFDDGPGAYTPELLDILKKYNVQASFFVVNTGAMRHIKRAAEEGHTVAIHTATHKFSEIYASEEAYFDDLYKMQQIIEQYTGKRTNLLRFPGGSSNTVSSFNEGIMTRLTKMVEELGFVYFDWNVDSMDAGGARTAQQVYNNVVKGVQGKTNAVVLMHDIKSYTVEAIERIIVWGLQNGYTFLPLTEDSPTCHHNINN